VICAYSKCTKGKEFEPKTHNQKYCSDECCRIATNEKLKQSYYEKKERLAGKKRICKKSGCNVILSRYNEKNICDKCSKEEEENERKFLIETVRNVTGKISKA